ncbi:MAG TPA: MFS transporter [Geminicoccaceae bacterium]|nr:MFS transporter [Geminicoccaceae bacterium]
MLVAPRSASLTSVEQPYSWVVVVVCMTMMAVALGAPYLVVVALKPIAAEFGWPRAVPSLCYALVLLGAGLGGLAMGRWADRAGIAAPALVGSLGISLGAWWASTAEGMLALYLSHGLLMGFLGNGAFIAPLLANASHWFDRRRGIAIALVASGQNLAGAVWPPVLRYLTDSYGWRQAFAIYALVALATLLPLSLVVRRPPPTGSHRTGTGSEPWSGQALGWPASVVQTMLCLAIVGCCVAMAMPMVHVIAHATDLGHPRARAAEMLSLLLGCALISRLLFGLVADRIGGLRTLLIGSAGQAVMLTSFAVVESFWGLYLISALFGLAFGGIVPCYALIVRELFPAGQAGWRIGAVILFGSIGMALGGWLGGQIFDLTGSYRSAFLVGGAFNLGNLALVGALLHRQGGAVRLRYAPP